LGRKLTTCILSILRTLAASTAGSQDEFNRTSRQERASFPLEHYRKAILRKEAYPWAHRYLAARQSAAHRDVLAAVPPCLRTPVQLIAEAVECGWFVMPNGKNGTFSARQFAEHWGMAAALPWLPDILQRALEAEARARHHRPTERHTFGVRRLPGFVDQALALPHRLSRLPLDHQAGAIMAELWFQVLADVHAATAALAAQIECFAPAWMWDPAASLEHQVERLRQHGCAHLLIAYVSHRDGRSDRRRRRRSGHLLQRHHQSDRCLDATLHSFAGFSRTCLASI